MVWKHAGAGAVIEWRREADTTKCDPVRPIFNVDFYLDGSGATNCLRGIPGSKAWRDEEAKHARESLGAGGFGTKGAVPTPMRPGDALLHDILVLHGSPACCSGLRRVLYFEFRPASLETRVEPHTPGDVPLKQRVLLCCLRDRTRAAWASGQRPFVYAPGSAFAPPPLAPDGRLASYRVPHHEHWRWD